MAKRLKKYNYFVLQISMIQLTQRILLEWIDEVRELWEDLQDELEN